MNERDWAEIREPESFGLEPVLTVHAPDYMFDLSAPIMGGTYRAALASAACALSSAQAITQGEKSAFALCRPPGHHADPDGEYPSFCGYTGERGAGQGFGAHRNFPLPAGTDDIRYLTAIEEALQLVRSFAPAFLVISSGMDIYEGDPLGTF